MANTTDALELLMQDHRKVEQLFEQIDQEGATPKAKELYLQIYRELTLHTVIEEQVFYPAIAKYAEFKDLLKDSYKEHAEAKREMGEIANTPYNAPSWLKMVDKLKGDIKHHVNDEEQKMFPKVSKTLNEQQLQELGKGLANAKSSKLNSDLLSQPGPVVIQNNPSLSA